MVHTPCCLACSGPIVSRCVSLILETQEPILPSPRWGPCLSLKCAIGHSPFFPGKQDASDHHVVCHSQQGNGVRSRQLELARVGLMDGFLTMGRLIGLSVPISSDHMLSVTNFLVLLVGWEWTMSTKPLGLFHLWSPQRDIHSPPIFIFFPFYFKTGIPHQIRNNFLLRL